jgi:hypothetical protein
MSIDSPSLPSRGLTLRNGYVVFLIFVAIAMALYSSSLNNPTLFDDYFFLVIHDRPESWHIGLAPRIFDFLTIFWTQKLFGNGFVPQRIDNICIHALNAALVFVLAKTLLGWLLARRPEEPDQERNIFYAALMASLLFLVHPVAVYDVAYLNQRSTLLATMGTLLTLLVFWEALVRNSWLYLIATLFFYLLALLGKEHSIMLPSLCVCLAILHNDGLRRARLVQLAFFCLACAGIAWWVVIHNEGDLILGKAPEYTSHVMLKNYAQMNPGFKQNHMLLYSIQTQATLFFNYWRFWLVPNPAAMSVDIRTAFATSMISVYTLGSALFLLYGIMAGLLLFFGRNRLLRFAGFTLLCPWLMFFTEFTSLRLQEIFVLYRSYLWFVFLVPATALAFYHWRGRLCLLVWALLVATFTVCSVNRINTFYSETALWRDAAYLTDTITDKRPGIERVYYNLGTAELKTDIPAVYPQALKHLLYAYHYVPDSELKPQIMYNLALTYKRMEDYKNAVSIYLLLVHEEDPENNSAWWLMGDSMERLGDEKSARAAYLQACHLKNRYACDRLKEDPNFGL